jgi:hypothetical protein
LDTALGIVTQRRCPDASTRIVHTYISHPVPKV